MKKKLLYWVPTTLILLLMVGSGIYYFVDLPGTIEAYTQLGYPTYTLYFNAIAKILGGIAIVSPVPKVLKEWAYAGYFFILALALQAVTIAMPGQQWPMLAFIGLWGLSYWQYRVQFAN